MPSSSGLTCVELCAGMGGMSLGLKRAGFHHIAIIERDGKCIETLRDNNFESVMKADVTNVDFTKFKNVDLVAGGVPCQGFSVAGKHLGVGDARNLWPTAIRAVRECRPRAFLFENSAAMASATHKAYLDEITRTMETLGYATTPHVVNASHYNCPQSRRRILLIGILHGCAYVPPACHSTTISVRAALHTLGDPDNENGHILANSHAREYKGHTPSSLDKPSKTIVSGVHGCGGGTNTIRLDDGAIRYYTPREMARIQTFPDTYRLPTTWSTAVRQLGNAAPPALVYAFAVPLHDTICMLRTQSVE